MWVAMARPTAGHHCPEIRPEAALDRTVKMQASRPLDRTVQQQALHTTALVRGSGRCRPM